MISTTGLLEEAAPAGGLEDTSLIGRFIGWIESCLREGRFNESGQMIVSENFLD